MASIFEGFVLKRTGNDVASRSAWRRIDIDAMSSGTFKKMIKEVERGNVDAEKQLQEIDGHFVRDQVRMWLAYRNDRERDADHVWILGALTPHRKSTVQNATLFRDKRITYTDTVDVLLRRKFLVAKSMKLPRSVRWTSDLDVPNPVVRSFSGMSDRPETYRDSNSPLPYRSFLRGCDTNDGEDDDERFFQAIYLDRGYEQIRITQSDEGKWHDTTSRRRQKQIEDDLKFARRFQDELVSRNPASSKLLDRDNFLPRGDDPSLYRSQGFLEALDRQIREETFQETMRSRVVARVMQEEQIELDRRLATRVANHGPRFW